MKNKAQVLPCALYTCAWTSKAQVWGYRQGGQVGRQELALKDAAGGGARGDLYNREFPPLNQFQEPKRQIIRKR